MIYVDTSVILAELLVEERQPKASLWRQPLVSSRLLQYETWTRVNTGGLAGSHGERTRELLGQAVDDETDYNVNLFNVQVKEVCHRKTAAPASK